MAEGQTNLYHGQCYCGSIHFVVDGSFKDVRPVYCHCDSCRRAHSAPLYQIVYVPVEAFKITEGVEFLNPFSRGEPSSPIRSFCAKCGSRIKNELPAKPEIVGFFPALLDESVQHNLPEIYKPVRHCNSKEATLPLHKLHDEIPR